jgi:quinol monooxygenase YgiN
MTGPVLTEVSAVVAPEREADLLAAFRDLGTRPLPDGLVRTELLSERDGRWRIQSLWRDHAALDAMRANPDPPAAPRLFREVGADPVLTVLDVPVQFVAPVEPS